MVSKHGMVGACLEVVFLALPPFLKAPPYQGIESLELSVAIAKTG